MFLKMGKKPYCSCSGVLRNDGIINFLRPSDELIASGPPLPFSVNFGDRNESNPIPFR